MTDYPKMYAILCGAIDRAIGPLEEIPAARPQAAQLRRALERAEEIYLDDGPEDTAEERTE